MMFGLERRAIIAGVIAIACVLALAAFAYQQWQSAVTAKIGERVATGQAGAAIESGGDAVQTIGNAQARETQIHETVKDATDAIEQAPAGNSNAAADRAACSLRAYRRQPRCIALLGPVAE